MSGLIKNNFLLLSWAQIDEKVESNYFYADFRSFWDPLTCSLAKDFQKEALLSI